MSTALTQPDTLQLNDPALLRQVAELRRTDNVTSWRYVAREYLFLAAVVGGAIAYFHWMEAKGLPWPWAVPVALFAIVLVGAGQHRLATLTHEAAHYMLFRNRLLNELVSEWLCMYPLLSTTHHYRVQHLGHHQYPNDPERDPDLTQLGRSGHRFALPTTRGAFLWHCFFKQLLWPPATIRYILVRAGFKVHRDDGGPYRLVSRPSAVLMAAGALYFVALVAALAWFVHADEPALLAAVPPGMLLGILALFAAAPANRFPDYVIRNDLPPKLVACMRLTYHTLVLVALAWLTCLTGRPWWLYYLVLWVVPLGTSFAFFMILRQVVQHGAADRGRLTNTRVFLVNPLLSAAVFPIGNDYHLPHHLFPMVPHYNLRKLHALLVRTAEYRGQAVTVDGYFFPREDPPAGPTVLGLMTRDAAE